MNVNLFYNLNKLINSANNTTSNYKSTNDVVNDMYNKYSKVLADRRKTDILTLSNNAIKTYNNKISVPASTGKTELNATKDGTHSYTIHFTSESEITSAIRDGRSSYTLKYNVEVDTKNIDVVMKKALENDKHIKFPKILIGVLTLIAVIIVFYFGGSIIETFYNIGRTLGNAIGDLFWK